MNYSGNVVCWLRSVYNIEEGEKSVNVKFPLGWALHVGTVVSYVIEISSGTVGSLHNILVLAEPPHT